MKDIAIIGAGLAGSNLAGWLYKYEFKGSVVVYDPMIRYSKPCGNVFLPQSLSYLSVIPRVTNEIKEYEIRVNGELVSSFTLDKGNRWVVVDKEALVEDMRALASRRFIFRWTRADPIAVKNDYRLVVDARGPFSNNGLRKILIARGLLESYEKTSDRIVLDFDTKRLGIFWAFPFEDMANVGYGAYFEKSPIDVLEKKLNASRLAKFDKKSVRTSLLTVDYPLIKNSEKNIVRIGEASGLVLPLGGEGNRLAAISSKALAEKIVKRESLSKFMRELKDLYIECCKQSYIFSIIGNIQMSDKVAKSMKHLDVEFYRRFLLGYLDVRRVLAVGFRERVFTLDAIPKTIIFLRKLFEATIL